MDNFNCKQCGRCCQWAGYVHLKDSEVDKIASFLGIEISEFTNIYTRLTENRTGLSLIEKPDNSCIFLAGDNKCMINPVKPEQCQRFPFSWNFEGWKNICKGAAD
jgi:Fe-S-cluster containining protein